MSFKTLRRNLSRSPFLKNESHFLENRNLKPDLGVFNDEKGPFGWLGRVAAPKKLDHILVVVSVLILLDKALAVLRDLILY